MWCSEAICAGMKTSERDTGPKSGQTYVTDGVVGASELRVLAGAAVVAMRGDQDYEKEGYCREGSHRVAVGKAVREPCLADLQLDGPRSPPLYYGPNLQNLDKHSQTWSELPCPPASNMILIMCIR